MKLIGVALLAGLMTAVLAVATGPHSSPVVVVPAVGAPVASRGTAALDRCRAISTPDTACEAAWDAEHHRFFGEAAK